MDVEYLFDFTCPYAYLGSLQIEAVCARASAGLRWTPILLGGVFRSLGADPNGLMDAMPAPKARHNAIDLQRFARRVGTTLTFPKSHPMRSVRALRATLAVGAERRPALIHAIYRAYWQRNDDITSETVVRAALEEVGCDAAERDRAIAANDDPAIKQALIEATERAVAKGVFGVPAMFVSRVENDPAPLMFFGQDRLAMVEAVLSGWEPGTNSPPAHMSRKKPARPGNVDFWFDFSSPFTYLASTQIERICRDTGATLTFRPMLLGAVFKAVGTANVPLFSMPAAKRAYMTREMTLWPAYWQVPFKFPSRFPQRTVTALRLVLLAGETTMPLIHALFRAIWVEDQNLEDDDTLRKILTSVGLGPELVEATRDEAIKQALITSTQAAIDAGVFGAPTCVVQTGGEPELFWGQDHLDLVAEKLERGA